MTFVTISSQHVQNQKPKHKQTISNNGFLVDICIKPLVDVINSIPQLQTFESCQGGNGEPAIVSFNFLGTNQELLRFASLLGHYLSNKSLTSKQQPINPAYEVDMSLKWCGDKTTPFFEISMPHEIIQEAVSIFSLYVIGVHYDI